jgi:hypothetical protein
MRINERQLRRLIRDIIVESEWNPGDVIKGTARATTQEDMLALSKDFQNIDQEVKNISLDLRKMFPQFNDKQIYDLAMASYQQKKMSKSMSSY